SVGIGTTATKSVSFLNGGTVPVTPTVISSSNADEFVVSSTSTCSVGKPIAVGATCTVQVAFTPSGAGARESTLAIAQQDGTWDGVTARAHLTGVGANGALSADPTSLDFGTVTVGQTAAARSFTVTNSGGLSTTIGTIVVSGGQAGGVPPGRGPCARAPPAPAPPRPP